MIPEKRRHSGARSVLDNNLSLHFVLNVNQRVSFARRPLVDSFANSLTGVAREPSVRWSRIDTRRSRGRQGGGKSQGP